MTTLENNRINNCLKKKWKGPPTKFKYSSIIRTWLVVFLSHSFRDEMIERQRMKNVSEFALARNEMRFGLFLNEQIGNLHKIILNLYEHKLFLKQFQCNDKIQMNIESWSVCIGVCACAPVFCLICVLFQFKLSSFIFWTSFNSIMVREWHIEWMHWIVWLSVARSTVSNEFDEYVCNEYEQKRRNKLWDSEPKERCKKPNNNWIFSMRTKRQTTYIFALHKWGIKSDVRISLVIASKKILGKDSVEQKFVLFNILISWFRFIFWFIELTTIKTIKRRKYQPLPRWE